MELGQRIKEARLEAGLSQRQLCGETCTRNMLSLIESGKAKPSMELLRYFAQQLGRPLSWFLNEDTASPNQQVIEKAEKALRNGAYSEGLGYLVDYHGPDPILDSSRYFLETVFLLALAEQAIGRKQLPYARQLLEKVPQAGANTAYPWDRQRWLLLRFAAGEQAQTLAPHLTGMEQRLQLLAAASLEAGDPAQAEVYLAAVNDRSYGWYLKMGSARLQQKEYAAAAELLQVVEAQFPAKCLPMLETCYRELGDFQQAYAYACKLREFQKKN